MQLYINGIGTWSSGWSGWPQAQNILSGAAVCEPQQALPMPQLLPQAERRRSPTSVKLAIQVAAEACAMAQATPADLPSVFASSHGDTEISDYMCRELALPQPALSPTRFHNSVHNAASGYWTIAVGCMRASNAISAATESFASGLLEAAALAVCENTPVLLVAYDIAVPPILLPLCPIPQTFAVALVLDPSASAHSIARIETTDASAATTQLPEFASTMMAANPAARVLPLLHAIANRSRCTLQLASQAWEVTPCQ